MLTQPIKIKNIIKIYKTKTIEVSALRGLTCELQPGKIHVIMGPSGCGKSTFLNILSGIENPSSGEIWLEDQDITKFKPEESEAFRLNRIGIIYQANNLIPALTAQDNIALPMVFQQRLSKQEIINRTQTLLDDVSLLDRKLHKPHMLSGGEQQRIAIAIAFANNPDLIIADEPTGELDSKARDNIQAIFKSYIRNNKNKAIVVVTHDDSFKNIADILMIMKDGKIIHTLSGKDLELHRKILERASEIQISNKIMTKVAQMKSLMDEIETTVIPDHKS